MDDLLAGHLVDQGNRVAERALHLRRIAGIDRRANGAQGAAEPGAVLAALLALDAVVPVRLDGGIVTSHKLPILAYPLSFGPSAGVIPAVRACPGCRPTPGA